MDNIKCLGCNNPVQEGYVFCPFCGMPLHQCPKCKNQCKPHDFFCNKCGQSLNEEKSAPKPKDFSDYSAFQVNGKSERSENQKEFYRNVTVMSVDIKGSTSLIQDLDPEEANNLIAPVFKVMKDTVQQHGGAIIQSGGDGIVASFGAPKLVEDHALRACLAAISMNKSAKSINKAIELRIGLNSGEIVLEIVGNQHHVDYSITGETANLATEIEKMTEPDAITISESTLNLLGNNVQVFPVGVINFAKKKVNVYELKTIQNDGFQLSVKLPTVFLQDISNMEHLRKHATVMFAKVAVSLAATPENPEVIANLRSDALKLMLNTIYRFTGTVIHITSNEIVATFGAPHAVEDHALRACLASLAIKTEIKSIDARLEVFIGLNSGKIFLEALDNQNLKYDISGPAVNLAARMEQTAKPNTIQITKSTHVLVEKNVVAETLGNAEIKGFKNKIEVFELISVKEKIMFEMDNNSFSSSFKGRELEVNIFNKSIAQVRNYKGMVINFSGPAGQGKSRLCYELTHLETVKDFAVYVVSGSYSHKNILLSPIIDLFCNIFNVEKEFADEEYIKEVVKNTVSSLDSSFAFNSTLSLLNINPNDKVWDEMEPFLKSKYIFKTGIDILSNLSLQKPLILIIENLHFVDTETESFINQLISSVESAGILLLLTSRPEYHDIWVNRSNYIRLFLNPLYPANGQEMLKELLGSDSSLEAINNKILSEWGGNPFFLEEIVKLLVSNKILIGSKNSYRLNVFPLVEKMQLPDTIFTVLQTQIDRLPMLQKRILEIVSVVGGSFKFSLIQELMVIDIKDLTGAISELCQNQLLCEKRIYPEPEYAFKNLLMGEVCYNNVLISTRKSLHAKLTSHFENTYKEPSQEQIQMMAHHAFLGDQWSKAFIYNVKAAKETFLMNAHKLSMHFYAQALSAAEFLKKDEELKEQIIYVHIEMAHLLLRLGLFEEQENHLKKGLELAIASQNIPLQCALYMFQTTFFLASKNVNDASEIAERAYELAQKSNSRDSMIVALSALIHADLFIGKYDEIYELVDQLVKVLPSIHYYPESCRVPFSYMNKAWLMISQGLTGNFAQAENDPKSLMYTENVYGMNLKSFFVNLALGLLYFKKGDYDKAIAYLNDGLKIAFEIDIVIGIPMLASALGCICLREGKVKEGEEYITQAINVGKTINFSFISALTFDSICEGAYLTGDLKKTQEVVDIAFKICQERQLQSPLPCLLRIEAMVDFHQQKSTHQAIEKKIMRSLKMAEELGLVPETGHAHLALANFYQEIGEEVFFKNELFKALEIYKQQCMSYWIRYCNELLTSQIV